MVPEKSDAQKREVSSSDARLSPAIPRKNRHQSSTQKRGNQRVCPSTINASCFGGRKVPGGAGTIWIANGMTEVLPGDSQEQGGRSPKPRPEGPGLNRREFH